ncbi:MAG TPA: tryptophan 2,3-dioxygenase family protein [Saprospiraceae bacterium]|nr:tryptophan 2,3-dioxygenase family protein [Saprospiraceae bacterium]
MDTPQKYSSIHYQSYLALEQLLSAQNPRSAEMETGEAHEEMLFIIVHQSYEIWFKQIIHELESVINMFNTDVVDEKNIGTAIARLNRVIQIFKLLVDHIPIMESMTPLDFLDFRNYLFPASGFQSYQFRKVENLLGLPEDERMTYAGHHYAAFFSDEQKAELDHIIKEKNLFNAVEAWLERIPFLQFENFNFLQEYRAAVERMLTKEEHAIRNSAYLSDKDKEMRIRMMGSTDTYFQTILDEQFHQQLVAEGRQRLSYKATLAALMINLYNEEPLLQLPYRFLLCIVDIDELLTTWRYRHAQMVLRMLGRKVGTGGSSGHDYLNETAQRHHIFKDFHNISTLLIPRSELPELPENVKKQLGFVYSK